MTQWTEGNPGAGDCEQVRAFGLEQGKRAARLGLAMREISRVNADVASESVSVAAETWMFRVGEFEPEFRKTITWFEDRKAAAYSYADAVELIAERSASLKRQINGFIQARTQVENQPIPDGTIAYQVGLIDERLNALNADLRRLGEQRDEADRTFSATLDAPLDVPGAASWSVAMQLYGPDALKGDYGQFRGTTTEILERMADRIRKIADDGLADEDLKELTNFFDALREDPGAANKFWDKVGGEVTRELFWRLGDDPFFRDAAPSWSLRAAQAARESVSAGSAAWSRSQAQRFVAGLYEKEGSNYGPVSPHDVVSYLFAVPEHSPMGEELTIATADRFDLDERRNGPPMFGALERPLWLEASRIPGGDTGPNPGTRDAMSQVMRTLSLYPESSLDWFTQTDITGAADASSRRGQYWFGERLWADDGLTGIAAAIESAMTVRGGIGGGPVYMDPDVWDKQALLIVDVIEGLGSAPASHFSPDMLSPEASRSLAGAIDRALPWLVETSIGSQSTSNDEREMAAELTDAQLFGTGDRLRAPDTDDRQLSWVWGTVAATAEGQQALGESVRDYQDTLFNNASYGEQTGVSWSAALDRIAKLEGFHQGSSGGVERYMASLDDELKAKRLGLAETALDIVPGSKALKAPIGVALHLESMKTGAEDQAVAGIQDDFRVKGAGFDLYLRDLFKNPPPGLDEQLMGQDLTGFLGDRADTFDKAYNDSLVNTNDRDIYDDFKQAQE